MTPFTALYCDAAAADARLNDDRLLALIRFDSSAVSPTDPRICVVPLPELDGGATVEVWLGARPAHTGVLNGVHYADNGDALFLHLHLDESAPDALASLTAAAYRRLFAAARVRGYPHPLRIWNYFPAINQEVGGLERYRAFCVGRHAALRAERAELATHLPAASAIGTREPGLRLYALAAREAGRQIENPRQVSAFHYPAQYGPQSPSFSRAILKHWGERDDHLYISGTASVVGHASQHLDPMAQLDETLLNLEALIAQANRRTPAPLHPALFRVYARSDLDPTPVRERIARAFGPDIPLLLLRADICRQDLLIEIEGLATSATTRHRQDPAP
jgi:chorismate lyase/3-hydroxybenzoate synthase